MEMKEPALKYETSLWPAEFINWERNAQTKHEYVDGRIIDMAGASIPHNKLLSNIIMNVGPVLKGKTCNIYPSDLRVYSVSKESYFYPDATIICGELEFSDEAKDTVTNPTVVFEILSPSTKDYDLGTKLYHYMQIKSMEQYIIIDSTNLFVHSWVRQKDGAWRFQESNEQTDQILIEPIDSMLHLEDIYEDIHFPNDLQRVKK